jgi:nicotinamide mononucleotide transporter
MSIAEIIGVFFSLWSVYLTMRRNIWCWPIGIVGVAASAFVFYQSKLYSDMWLQVFFVATGFQGWYFWLRGGDDKTELPVTRLTSQQIFFLIPATAVAVLLVGAFFAQFTDAHLPYWDATASGMSVVAQILLMRKKLENWHLWIIVDVLYVGIYTYKQLYLFAGLYAIFIFLAVGGLLSWQKEWIKQRENAPEPASSSENSSR